METITPAHYMVLSAALFVIGVIGVMVRRNIIIIFMSIELILNAVNINLVVVLVRAAQRHRSGVRHLCHCGGGGRSGGRARDHSRVLSQQGDRQHRRNESHAVVRVQIADFRVPIQIESLNLRLKSASAICNLNAAICNFRKGFMEYIWLIPLLPGIGAAVNGLVGIRAFSEQGGRRRGVRDDDARVGSVVCAFWQLLGLPSEERAFDVDVGDLDPTDSAASQRRDVGHALGVPWGFRLDPLSAMMMLVVTGIGTLIHVYSTAYMADEPRGGVARFFCYLNLFCFFMLMLVLGNNFLVMFVGWEGRGALLVPAHRLLVREEERGRRRQEGVHRQPDRRLGLHPRRSS